MLDYVWMKDSDLGGCIIVNLDDLERFSNVTVL